MVAYLQRPVSFTCRAIFERIEQVSPRGAPVHRCDEESSAHQPLKKVTRTLSCLIPHNHTSLSQRSPFRDGVKNLTLLHVQWNKICRFTRKDRTHNYISHAKEIPDDRTDSINIELFIKGFCPYHSQATSS